jgi:hypothetical protein
MKMKSSCEKGHNLGQHRIEAQIGDGLTTWEYSPVFGKSAFIRTTLGIHRVALVAPQHGAGGAGQAFVHVRY